MKQTLKQFGQDMAELFSFRNPVIYVMIYACFMIIVVNMAIQPTPTASPAKQLRQLFQAYKAERAQLHSKVEQLESKLKQATAERIDRQEVLRMIQEQTPKGWFFNQPAGTQASIRASFTGKIAEEL